MFSTGSSDHWDKTMSEKSQIFLPGCLDLWGISGLKTTFNFSTGLKMTGGTSWEACCRSRASSCPRRGRRCSRWGGGRCPPAPASGTWTGRCRPAGRAACPPCGVWPTGEILINPFVPRVRKITNTQFNFKSTYNRWICKENGLSWRSL